MYIPISYWQTQGGGTPHLLLNYFSTPTQGVPKTINFEYNDVPLTATTSVVREIIPVCQDSPNFDSVVSSNGWAGAPFFCSADFIPSFTPCNSYLFAYNSISCGAGGNATARYYDCSGILKERTVSGGNSFVACATAFGSQPCVITELSGSNCSSSVTETEQCCITSPPNTGAEAWYIDVSYRMAFDNGTVYWNYVDINGNIINETLTFGETKRIIAQTPPIWNRSTSNFYNAYCNWTMIEKFPGQVIPYPYRTVPATYNIQLKRANVIPTNVFPNISYVTASIDANGFPSASNLAYIFIPSATASIGTTMNMVSTGIPVDYNGTNNSTPPSIWITGVTPLPKGAHRLESCSTTHSLWVTLNGYAKYASGSVLKTDTPALTATSSCWTVTSLASSVSVSVALPNVNITGQYGTCSVCLAS